MIYDEMTHNVVYLFSIYHSEVITLNLGVWDFIECRGSTVRCRGSDVEGQGFKVESRGSKVEGRR